MSPEKKPSKKKSAASKNETVTPPPEAPAPSPAAPKAAAKKATRSKAKKEDSQQPDLPVAAKATVAVPAPAKSTPAAALAPAKATAAKPEPAAAKAETPAPAKPARKKAPAKIPAILLEGDATPAPSSGPKGRGDRYALAPSAGAPQAVPEVGELPEAYGTRKLLLTARDPNWLYASWDLTREQQKEFNALSLKGHLVVRVYKNAAKGNPVVETEVHPESRNWFIHVPDADTKYVAELGFYGKGNKWENISTSRPTLTPPDNLSEDLSVEFATLPTDITFQKLLQLLQAAIPENVPLIEAIEQFRTLGHKGLPSVKKEKGSQWTPAQAEALGKLVTIDHMRRVWVGSLEITELIRRRLQDDLSSLAVAQLSKVASGLGLSSLSSPFGGAPEKGKSFWFNVNAELIIYGSTEPDAKVTIGGKDIKLRPDGSFSFRFALPDGRYQLVATAVSADATDSRSADLNFSRKTGYTGDVGTHPQDKALKLPRPENVS